MGVEAEEGLDRGRVYPGLEIEDVTSIRKVREGRVHSYSPERCDIRSQVIQGLPKCPSLLVREDTLIFC